ncbi:MAG: ROK family protein [Theionarchaea archaeon]|nr:MAG: hypothetical protein AYK19_09110 [Theionarchaea archaeon DG-70-1]MBU7026652.1 ROK family protein [Theionarchaea archaeon]
MVCFIFDKDGVLVDTEEGKILSYYRVLEEKISDKIPEWEEYRKFHAEALSGKSRNDVVKGIIQEYPSLRNALIESKRDLEQKRKSGNFNVPKYKEVKKQIKEGRKNYGSINNFPPELLLSVHRLIQYADIPLEEKCRPITPMVEFVQSLQDNKMPTCLITVSEFDRTQQELEYVRKKLPHINVDINKFEIVACKDKIYWKDNKRESESPGEKDKMYCLIRKELHKKYKEFVAIEDTEPGMQAALDGEFPCFLPCKGYYDKEVVSFLEALCTPNAEMREPYIVGVDFGGTRTKVGFGKILWLFIPCTFEEKKPEDILDFLRRLYTPKVQAFGIALACTMVPAGEICKGERRVSKYSTKFASLSQVKNGTIREIQESWSEKLRVPVFILNDGEAAAIAEYQALKRCQEKEECRYTDVLVITLGTSIGAGFIFHDEPYIGPYTSRASHIILDPDGEWCIGENHQGCWKTMTGRDALLDLAKKMGYQVDPERITEMAQKGDRKARLFYELYAERVARGIATIAGAVPFKCVIIGGGTAKAGDVLLDLIRERLEKGDLLDPEIGSALKILTAQSREPVVAGAQLYAEEMLQKKCEKESSST